MSNFAYYNYDMRSRGQAELAVVTFEGRVRVWSVVLHFVGVEA